MGLGDGDCILPDVREHGFEVVATCHPLGTRGKTTAVTAANKSKQLDDWASMTGPRPSSSHRDDYRRRNSDSTAVRSDVS